MQIHLPNEIPTEIYINFPPNVTQKIFWGHMTSAEETLRDSGYDHIQWHPLEPLPGPTLSPMAATKRFSLGTIPGILP